MARIVVPGQPHYVIQRWNKRQDVYFVDDHRRAYFEFLREHCELTCYLFGNPVVHFRRAIRILRNCR
ncbi:MAG: hypothetical protein IH897_03815 [Planctomycetes bacterium]|nr:hypothetical protein [Planctomycetota bacterium]